MTQMGATNPVVEHFARVAAAYRTVRTTDPEPVAYIRKHSRRAGRLVAADIGAGAGRYDLMLYRTFGNRLKLRCVDVTPEMLAELDAYLRGEGIESHSVHLASADDLPFEDDSLDLIFTFNACHHFDLPGFLAESRRTLRRGGRMFIYTRTPLQNARGGWGQYFPGFAERENRLYTLGDVAGAVAATPGIELSGIQEFQYDRTVSLERLVFQARNRHYSTFDMYGDGEFESALAGFVSNIRAEFRDTEHIPWYDENIMYVVDRRP